MIITQIEQKFGISAIVALAVLTGCSSSTTTNNVPASGSGLPAQGSIFTYLDSAPDIQTGQYVVMNESDTVVHSGITIQGVTNTIILSPNSRTFLFYSRMTLDSTMNTSHDSTTDTTTETAASTEVDAGGPPMFAVTSSGDLSIPTASTTHIVTDSLGHVLHIDSTVLWFVYPIKTHTTLFITSEQWPSPTDSIAWAQPATFSVQNTSLTCEHVVRLHHTFVGTGQDVNPVKTDLYFSTNLGMPVAIIVNQPDANGKFVSVASKHLVRY